MTGTQDPLGYDQAVRSWAHHLRSGGTTPWLGWLAAPPERPPEQPARTAGWDEALPGAAQLELVRRLAQRVTPGPGFAALADLALGRSGPGRGLAQQPLVWDGPARRFGPPPVDPADVAAEELVRVGVGVLAELLLLPAAQTPVPADPWRRPWTRSPAFVLEGAPVTAAAVRRALAAAGHVEGGRAPQVVLLAQPLDVALAQVWSTRVQAGAPVRWRGFVERCARGAGLPDSVDLPALARHWADRVGPAAVHVVAREGAAVRAVADVLGVSLALRRRDVAPRWADLAPEAVDVVRRVNAVLAVRVGDDRSGAARRRLVSGLAEQRSADVLTVPPRFRGWLRRRAAALVEELAAGHYAVHGGLEALVPRPATRPALLRPAGTLQVVLDACVQQADLAGLEPTRAKEH